MNYDYDLFVIGGGGAGVRAARTYGQKGYRVALAEDQALGGTCVNLGCIPKKLLYYASLAPKELKGFKEFGWSFQDLDASFDMALFGEKKAAYIQKLNQIYQTLLSKASVTLYPHRASLVGPHQLQVGKETISAKRILLATGGVPKKISFPGSEHSITSNELFFLKKLPRRAIVIGSGYIGLESASFLSALGSEVFLFDHSGKPLRHHDSDLAQIWHQSLQQRGIQWTFEAKMERLEKEGSTIKATYLQQGKPAEISCDMVLQAVGRTPNTQNLGLEHTQVQIASTGHILTPSPLQTHEPSIYAAGDIIQHHGLDLTPVAIAEGSHLIANLEREDRGEEPMALNYEAVPTAVFTQPTVAMVGPNEKSLAQDMGADALKIYTHQFTPLKEALIADPSHKQAVFLKLITAKQDGRLLGAQMLGEGADEMIQLLAVAIKAGLCKADLDATFNLHPTIAEEWVSLS